MGLYEDKLMDIYTRVYAAKISTGTNNAGANVSAKEAVNHFHEAFPKADYLEAQKPAMITFFGQDYKEPEEGFSVNSLPEKVKSVYIMELSDIMGILDISIPFVRNTLLEKEKFIIDHYGIQTILLIRGSEYCYSYDGFDYFDQFCKANNQPFIMPLISWETNEERLEALSIIKAIETKRKLL